MMLSPYGLGSPRALPRPPRPMASRSPYMASASSWVSPYGMLGRGNDMMPDPAGQQTPQPAPTATSPYDTWRQSWLKGLGTPVQNGKYPYQPPGMGSHGPPALGGMVTGGQPPARPTFTTPGQVVPIQLQDRMYSQGWRVGSDGLWHPPEQGPPKSPYQLY